MPDLVAVTGQLVKHCLYESTPGVSDCPTKVFARGYCEKHYRQLRRAGAFALDTKPQTDSAIVLANVRSVRRARKRLLKSAPDIVDAFVLGMKNQAQQGKTEASQWAILHTHILDPVATADKNGNGNSGVVINVGVKVSGASDKP